MNPIERTWAWWAHLVDMPYWDPWLAALAIAAMGLAVFYVLHRLLRP